MTLASTKFSSHLFRWFERYWFLSALFGICLLTVADHAGILVHAGRWLKNHHAPDMVIMSIFLLSGFALNMEQLKGGLKDLKGMLLAFTIIFVAAPLAAILFARLPLDTGIIIGLFLVSAMPTTLSSGVVMTSAAGGNAAHALIITIAANSLSVFTIPYVLSGLLMIIGDSTAITIDKSAIMLKIVLLVILPLILGMMARRFIAFIYQRFRNKIALINQCLILLIVWIAMSQTRAMVVSSGTRVALVVGMVFTYHGLLLLCGWCLIWLSGRRRGKRESILFMGAQKTLPLSIILQMSLFPQYGIALLVCVLHHIVHLMMDGYLVGRLRAWVKTSSKTR
jgi:solute carrier family 10 (sodium/bile acid cotransporter), member 7